MNTLQTAPDIIPELDISQRLDPAPERTVVALDARALEKTMVTQLVATWLEALRPEMERMAHQIVQRSAEAYWRQHAAEPQTR